MQVPTLPLAVARVNGIQWSGTLGLGWDWRSRVGSAASPTFSLPFLRSHIPSFSRLSRRCWVCQGTRLAIRVMFWGLGCSGWESGMPFQRKSHKNALIWAHFYPCWWVTWEFLVFSCLPFFPSVLPWVGKGVLGRVWFPKHLASSHSQVAVSFRMPSGTSFLCIL